MAISRRSLPKAKLDVWPDEDYADVSLQLESGPRFRIGEISVSQDFLDARIAEAYIDIQSGDAYDSNALARAFRDLSDSVYFSSIDIFPDIEDAADGEIPIRIRLEPGTRIEYTVGIGYSTDAGARLRTGFSKQSHQSQRSPADRGSEYRRDCFRASPRNTGSRRETRGANGSVSPAHCSLRKRTPSKAIFRTLGFRWTRVMSDRWLRTLALDISNESYELATEVRTAKSVVPAIIFDTKNADRDVFPDRGHRLTVELRGTDKILGSNSAYLQAVLRTRWIRSLGDRNRVLARLNAGVTESPDFDRLPPSARFFAGGDESIRGFQFESLGPKDADGNVVGGSNLLVASLEFERRLSDSFYGAVFVDAGNAFDGSDFDTEVGAGIGIKWRSPVGAIRLYLGYPVSADDGSLRLHLRLGAEL